MRGFEDVEGPAEGFMGSSWWLPPETTTDLLGPSQPPGKRLPSWSCELPFLQREVEAWGLLRRLGVGLHTRKEVLLLIDKPECSRTPGTCSQQASAGPQTGAWQPSPPAARSWPPTTTTGAAWVPLPATAPAAAPSTLGKPSPTTPVSPRPTRVTGGRASFLGSPLSHSWPQCWSPQSTRSPPRPPAAPSRVTWLQKPRGSSLVASLPKPMLGPGPE